MKFWKKWFHLWRKTEMIKLLKSNNNVMMNSPLRRPLMLQKKKKKLLRAIKINWLIKRLVLKLKNQKNKMLKELKEWFLLIKKLNLLELLLVNKWLKKLILIKQLIRNFLKIYWFRYVILMINPPFLISFFCFLGPHKNDGSNYLY